MDATADYGPRYPARRLLEIVGDKWTAVVLYSLAGEAKRFGEIQREIPDITKKVLTQVLRALELGGLVERTTYPESPPRIEYKLTEDGERLHGPVAALCDWAAANDAFLDEIHRRREV